MITLHGEIEDTELVPRQRVRAALEYDRSGLEPVHDVLDDLKRQTSVSLAFVSRARCLGEHTGSKMPLYVSSVIPSRKGTLTA